MKKRFVSVILTLLLLIGCSGCSVFSDMADQILGQQATPEPIVLSEYYDPVKAQQEAEAAEKAARTLYSADELKSLIAPSIVKVNAYNKSGDIISTCGGFFAYGSVFTSMDSILNAERATIALNDGGEYEVTGVRYYNADMNIAVLACSRQDSPDLAAAKWGAEIGDTVYALGPDGASTEGSLLAAGVNINGFDCVQISAAINESNAGGPLVTAYGELLGFCVMDAAGDGQSYAVSTASMEGIDQSQTISMEDFRAANTVVPEGTKVLTGDSGEKIYDNAGYYIEVEPNDTTDEATELVEGAWTAAFINREGHGEGDTADSVDIFSFTVEEKSTVEILLRSYYKEDAKYLDGTWVTNADLDHLADEYGNYTGYITAYDQDGNSYQRGECEVEAGTYYVVVKLTSGYSEDNGAYYSICYNVK